ncbi:hypothetical protein ACFQMA_18350 [Halosimplex aquaticum]|uniref:Uncharacterized protein n=1 Tax=Halosimplex aquaticum TaxID=3026162 RepID=A0ABD5Y7L0_9EURY|nr:hypothetical protein [Halosimplex aquaticum]
MVELNRADGDHVDEGDDDEAETERSETEHLENVEDGCGCTEIWEHLSDERAED